MPEVYVAVAEPRHAVGAELNVVTPLRHPKQEKLQHAAADILQQELPAELPLEMHTQDFLQVVAEGKIVADGRLLLPWSIGVAANQRVLGPEYYASGSHFQARMILSPPCTVSWPMAELHRTSELDPVASYWMPRHLSLAGC